MGLLWSGINAKINILHDGISNLHDGICNMLYAMCAMHCDIFILHEYNRSLFDYFCILPGDISDLHHGICNVRDDHSQFQYFRWLLSSMNAACLVIRDVETVLC